MKTRHVVFLAVVFGALVAVYAMTDRLLPRPEVATPTAMPVFDFAPEAISALSIEQPGEDPVEGVRTEDGSWDIVAPYRHIPANQSRWNQIAETLASMQNSRTVAEDFPDRTLFELDAPVLTILVGTSDGTLQDIRFGALDPTQANRYAQVGDGDVFLVRAQTVAALDHDLLDLRDRGMFTHLREGITRIDYERLPTDAEHVADIEDESVIAASTAIRETYALEDDGTWRVVAPIDARAHQGRVSLLAQNLRALSVREYIDDPENLADFGLQPPFARLTAYNAADESQTLLLGWIADDPENAGLFAKRTDNPSVFVVDARIVSLLPSEAGGFREKRLFTHEAKNLETITYTDTSTRIVLENDPDSGWQMIEPAAPTTDQVAASMYVAQLKGIEGDAFPERQPPDEVFGSPRATLEFTYTDGTEPTTIVVGAPVPGSSPLRLYARQDFGVITEIAFEDFQAIKATPFDFRIKTIFPFRPEWITSLEVSLDGVDYRFERTNNRWLLAAPSGYRLQAQSDVSNLIRAFTESTATGMAAQGLDETVTGLDDPLLRVRFTLDESIVDRQMGWASIGNRKTEQSRDRFLRVEGSEEVFYVDQGLVDRVRDALRGVVPSRD